MKPRQRVRGAFPTGRATGRSRGVVAGGELMRSTHVEHLNGYPDAMNRDKPKNGIWGRIRHRLKNLVTNGGLLAPGWGFGRRSR